MRVSPSVFARAFKSIIKPGKEKGKFTKDMILGLPSTPIMSPSYPRGPYFFKNREYFIVTYETDAEALRALVPEPLVPNENSHVLYEWINMPDSSGFGSYSESGIVIPCTYNGESVNLTLQMYLDIEPPIAAGREIWGFPKKHAHPSMKCIQDTVVGVMKYKGETVAQGTMAYKHTELDHDTVLKSMGKTNINLKIIPDVDFKPKIAQIVSYNLQVKKLHFAFEGPARLHLVENVNAPVADLPVKKVIQGKHMMADILLPYGNVLHDYLEPTEENKAVSQKFHQMFVQPGQYRSIFTEKKITEESLAMPVTCPSYKPSASKLQDREYMVIKYVTDRESLLEKIPDQLTPNEDNIVILQFVNTHGTGIGSYYKVDLIVPCTDNEGNSIHFNTMSFLDSSSPITYGRECLGLPQKFCDGITFAPTQDTLKGTLDCNGCRVATGTMSYKYERMAFEDVVSYLSTPQLFLKHIPDVRGDPAIVQLVRMEHANLNVTSAYKGDAKLALIPHVNAPISDLPVKQVVGAFNFKVDMIMPAGRVHHDYLQH
ncbi:predicted protein [Naegleria gruberi]|uniref:Predicted protein n=1 Tax=Naegleria gruberi TaxID=5762 RepID=D2VGY2_NAEGR|nr:uncharacterized protein NAEGRDRAFT_79950 [Naegleria gruberi]EFC43884.1 predicted protein [Naegleria gruberi]|eukprot:XP_002676628.1 predicted protein [Naegleria gruberi strain NEG-M]